MAEYISKDTALYEINHWWTYVLMCDGEPSLNNTIKELPPADVVERTMNDKLQTKLDKIEEIVNRELIAGKCNYQTCYQAFFEIVDVMQK